ncbi:hypothetical protein B0H16DRAFT_1806377 [Mycena metata]|uniref:Uncharacterized protein n=1 Tax=Mycena metata TaxID=1033252 RepID=A0AAD7H9I9_9AGAR|nr:hypothetical protein B0H16DRAFT_1806377 [Mycena metata]
MHYLKTLENGDVNKVIGDSWSPKLNLSSLPSSASSTPRSSGTSSPKSTLPPRLQTPPPSPTLLHALPTISTPPTSREPRTRMRATRRRRLTHTLSPSPPHPHEPLANAPARTHPLPSRPSTSHARAPPSPRTHTTPASAFAPPAAPRPCTHAHRRRRVRTPPPRPRTHTTPTSAFARHPRRLHATPVFAFARHPRVRICTPSRPSTLYARAPPSPRTHTTPTSAFARHPRVRVCTPPRVSVCTPPPRSHLHATPRVRICTPSRPSTLYARAPPSPRTHTTPTSAFARHPRVRVCTPPPRPRLHATPAFAFARHPRVRICTPSRPLDLVRKRTAVAAYAHHPHVRVCTPPPRSHLHATPASAFAPPAAPRPCTHAHPVVAYARHPRVRVCTPRRHLDLAPRKEAAAPVRRCRLASYAAALARTHARRASSAREADAAAVPALPFTRTPRSSTRSPPPPHPQRAASRALACAPHAASTRGCAARMHARSPHPSPSSLSHCTPCALSSTPSFVSSSGRGSLRLPGQVCVWGVEEGCLVPAHPPQTLGPRCTHARTQAARAVLPDLSHTRTHAASRARRIHPLPCTSASASHLHPRRSSLCTAATKHPPTRAATSPLRCSRAPTTPTAVFILFRPAVHLSASHPPQTLGLRRKLPAECALRVAAEYALCAAVQSAFARAARLHAHRAARVRTPPRLPLQPAPAPARPLLHPARIFLWDSRPAFCGRIAGGSLANSLACRLAPASHPHVPPPPNSPPLPASNFIAGIYTAHAYLGVAPRTDPVPNSAISQPAWEYIVKIVEMSLWSSDFVIAHFLLIILTPPILIPGANRLHSTMLLASALEANPRTVVLDETKEATKMDCSKIFHCLCRGLRFPSCVDRLACTIPQSYYLQLHAVQEHLMILSAGSCSTQLRSSCLQREFFEEALGEAGEHAASAELRPAIDLNAVGYGVLRTRWCRDGGYVRDSAGE